MIDFFNRIPEMEFKVEEENLQKKLSINVPFLFENLDVE